MTLWLDIKILVAVSSRSASAQGSSCYGLDEFGDCPNVISNSGFHCGSRTKGAMNTAEVIKGEPQSVGGFQVIPLFAESVCKPCQSPHSHANRKILSLNMRSTNSVDVWVSPLWDSHGVYDFSGRVPLLAVSGAGVDLNQLSEVNTSAKAVLDGIHISLESVRGDLEFPLRCLVNFLGERHGIAAGPPAQVPSENDFAIPLDGDKAPRIAAKRIAGDIFLFLAADESPQLVALDIGDGQIVDSILQKPLALLANENEQGKNRSVMEASHALDGADGASFNKKLNRFGRFLDRCVHATKRRSVIFGEGLRALAAAIALKAVSVVSEFLAAGIAVVTGHRLAFLREQADNGFGSALRLTPRADLAPSSASTGGGASYLLPTKSKSKRITSLAASDFSALKESLQNRVYERERILDSSKVITPTQKHISHLDSSHLLTLRTIKRIAHELCPCHFRPLVLSKCVANSNRCRLQLGDFNVQLIPRMILAGNLFFDFFQSFLECFCHWILQSNAPPLYTLGV